MLFIGDDWAEAHHDIEIEDDTGRLLVRRRLLEGLAGISMLHELVAEHLDPAGEPDQVMVGIETERGSWVQALLGAGYVVYPINPMQVARYRERHSTSGAKSDPGDAHLLAEIVRLDRAHHRPIAGDSEIAEHEAQLVSDIDVIGVVPVNRAKASLSRNRWTPAVSPTIRAAGSTPQPGMASSDGASWRTRSRSSCSSPKIWLLRSWQAQQQFPGEPSHHTVEPVELGQQLRHQGVPAQPTGCGSPSGPRPSIGLAPATLGHRRSTGQPPTGGSDDGSPPTRTHPGVGIGFLGQPPRPGQQVEVAFGVSSDRLLIDPTPHLVDRDDGVRALM